MKKNKKRILMSIGCLMVVGVLCCLAYSHCLYSKRATAAKVLPEGGKARPGRIYFASFPENNLELDLWGWHPNIGHASLVTRDATGQIKQYDYGWFVNHENERPSDAIGYVSKDPSYGAVTCKVYSTEESEKGTNDMEVARMVLETMEGYGNKVEVWAKDVDDVGIAERYMEQLAYDENRGSMAWRCWQIGGYRCGNMTRQAFDAARGEGHFLDLLWGGFPGADAPSIGTDKTVFTRD